MERLATLARLGAQEVERERRALGALDQTIGRLHRRLEAWRAEQERELRAGVSLGAGPSLAAFLEASRERIRAARAELRRLAAEREAQAARLLDRRLELKRLELLIARQRQRREIEARRREQGAADALALLRMARLRTRARG
jgi:flagellar export protein FliJ